MFCRQNNINLLLMQMVRLHRLDYWGQRQQIGKKKYIELLMERITTLHLVEVLII
ncbi:hypothetical protein D3C80_1276290 [compost metagenome]